jgi:DNA modification methylase
MGVKLGDARQLPMNDGRAHAVITSPPYPGVYDYVEHHRLRLDWLGLDTEHLQEHEIGAHRHYAYADPDEAKCRWAEQFGPCLEEMRRVLAPEGKIALLMADSVVAKQAFYVDRALCDLVGNHGLRVVSAVSQRREHFHAPTQTAFREAPRREHLIVLMATKGVTLPQEGRSTVQNRQDHSTRHGSARRRRVP